jgi:hypothetical protein
MAEDQTKPISMLILLILLGLILSCCSTQNNSHQLKFSGKTTTSILSFGSHASTTVTKTYPHYSSTTTTYPPNIRTIGFLPQTATFVSTEIGWVIGIDPFKCFNSPTCVAIESTQDGGTTWSQPDYNLPKIFTLDAINGIKFLNSSEGWVYGKFGLFQTNNGGLTWSKITLPSFNNNSFISDIAVGQNNLYILDTNFTTCPANEPSPCKFIGKVISLNLNNESINDISLVSKTLTYYLLASPILIDAYNNWAMVDFGTESEIYQTFNNGITWTQMKVPPCPTFSGPEFTIVNFESENIALVCSSDMGMHQGTTAIYLSNNSGSTFTQIEHKNIGVLFGLIVMSSPDQLVIELDAPAPPDIEVISPTSTTWVSVDQQHLQDGTSVSDLGMITSQVGYFISEIPTLAIEIPNNNYDYMYMTFDGGNSWEKLNLTP